MAAPGGGFALLLSMVVPLAGACRGTPPAESERSASPAAPPPASEPTGAPAGKPADDEPK